MSCKNRGWNMLIFLRTVLPLRQTIAISYMCKWNKYFCGSGLDEIIQIISRAVITSGGDNIVTAGEHSHSMSSCIIERLRSERSCVNKLTVYTTLEEISSVVDNDNKNCIGFVTRQSNRQHCEWPKIDSFIEVLVKYVNCHWWSVTWIRTSKRFRRDMYRF